MSPALLEQILTEMRDLKAEVAAMKRAAAAPQRRAWAPKEVGQMLGLPARTVVDHINDGLIHAKKVGKRWLIPDAEVRRLLAEETTSDG